MTDSRFLRMAGAGMAFYLAATGTAEAAKGIKKVAPVNNNAPRMLTGVVVSVSHLNGRASFHIRTAQYHKKRGMVNQGVANQAGVVNQAGVAGGNVQHHNHLLHVTAATRFGFQNGNPASFAALRRGERVRVQATGNQANAVQILSFHRMRGVVNRHRNNVYRPHLYQHHVMHHHRRR